MIIRCDTREQNPLIFEPARAVRGTIATFDYAIEGDQNAFAVERKSLADLIQSLAMSRSFTRELKKIRRARSIHHMPRIFYVVEANREDVDHFDYSVFMRGRVTPQFIYRQLSILEYVHDVHIIFSGDALGAARDVHRILKRRAEDLKAQEADS
ncbi:ERCC4 domain-containing protein [Pontiellaceae bacterium B12227]|nr:ERCC4 domain-containing protein [Pontiellaceae bacterium B12227]